MSTITVTNIKATGETASRAVSGVAAAWVNFNGTGTIAIRDSQGVSGLVDEGTGEYIVNLSNSFAAANYCLTLSGSHNTDADEGLDIDVAGFQAGSFAYNNRNGAGTYYDTSILCGEANGDLA